MYNVYIFYIYYILYIYIVYICLITLKARTFRSTLMYMTVYMYIPVYIYCVILGSCTHTYHMKIVSCVPGLHWVHAGSKGGRAIASFAETIIPEGNSLWNKAICQDLNKITKPWPYCTKWMRKCRRCFILMRDYDRNCADLSTQKTYRNILFMKKHPSHIKYITYVSCTVMNYRVWNTG